MLHKHDNDLYRGDARAAGLTTRMQLGEERDRELRENIEKMASNWKTIILMFVGTLLSAVANLILHLLGK